MTNLHFKHKSPCTSCPYSKDAKLRHWGVSEFIALLKTEKDYMGTVYACHKKNGSVCIGWLIQQNKNNFPSIMLRLKLTRENISRDYLDSLTCKSELFSSVQEMTLENYPELKKIIKTL